MSTSKRVIKYKCPYCEERYTKVDLVPHVGEVHEDYIPEGYTPLRVVFDYINKKPANYNGRCTECGGPTGWDENKGRYNRQCSNPKCRESYIKKFEKNMKDKLGVTRISSTPEGQEKMLANRKISGKYKFQDGGERTYTGKYEKATLEFLDKVMNCSSADVITPGPVIEYTYKKQKHFYISDMYYQPYNLVIEVKDGGDNPNNRDMKEYREKQIEKERAIIKNTDYNYIRLTNNDLSQLMSVFAELKMELVDNTNDRVIDINEGAIFNEKDILYNKDKFDSGEINLCFITGHSGSGKTTMANSMADDNTEVYELDDLIANKTHFTIEQMKEYGDLYYSYFTGSGKKFWYTIEDIKEGKAKSVGDNYEVLLLDDFIEYAKSYAKSHKNKKYILEGIWLYMYTDPSRLQDYAVYIKGTSKLVSDLRASKRDSNHLHRFLNVFKSSDAEKQIKKYREYFNKLMKTNDNNTISEAMNALLSGSMPGIKDTQSVYIVNYLQNNVFSGHEEMNYAISDNIGLTNLICRDREGVLRKAPKKILENAIYTVYKVPGITPQEVSDKLAPYMNTFVEYGFLYETVTGKKMYDDAQILYDPELKECVTPKEYIGIKCEILENLLADSVDETSPVNIHSMITENSNGISILSTILSNNSFSLSTDNNYPAMIIERQKDKHNDNIDSLRYVFDSIVKGGN